MTEVENRNLGGLRHDDAESDRGGGAGRLRAQARSPRFPSADFKVQGGLLFADGPVNETRDEVLPRGAVSYLLNEKTVVRGGVGLFSYDYFFDNINQAGFSQATPVHRRPTTTALTFTGANLTNPIPSGTARCSRSASALGLRQPARPEPRHALPAGSRGAVLHALGSRACSAISAAAGSSRVDLPRIARHAICRSSATVNNIPIQYLSTSRTRDTANETFLTANVANPFAGLLPGSTINGATVQRQQLLRPFPEFGTFAIEEYTGSDRYDAAHAPAREALPQRQLVHDAVHALVAARQAELPEPGGRHARGSRLAQRPAEPVLDRLEPAAAVRPRREVGHDWNGALDAVLGGWQVSGTYQYQSGFPLTWNNIYYDSAAAIRASLVSNIGEKVSGGDRRTRRAGVGHHRASTSTTRRCRPTAWTTRRSSAPTRASSSATTCATSRRRCRTCARDNLHLMDFGLYKNFSLPREHEAAGALRVRSTR